MALVKLNTALVGLVVVIGLAAGALSAPGSAPGSAAPPPAEAKPAPAPVDPPAAGAAELQGTWTLVETHTRGKKVAPADIPTFHTKLVVAGARVTLHTKIGSEKGTVEVDPRATPKAFTFRWLINWTGIYAVDGDTLKLCFNPANGIRPNEIGRAHV